MKNESLFDAIQDKQGLAAKNLSQMSYIGDLGVSAATEERERATARKKLERRHANLQKVANVLAKIQGRISGLPVMGTDQRRSVLRKAIASIDKMTSQKACPVGTATPLRKLRNDLVSIQEISGNLTAKTSMLRSTQIVSTMEAVNSLIAKSQVKLQADDSLSVGRADYSNAFSEAEKILKRNNEAVKRLDSINNRPFTLVRVPLVVISDPAINVSMLDRSGLKSEDLAGYPLLHNQMVLGVSKKAFEEQKRVKNIEDFVQELLQVLRKQVKKPLVLVDSTATRAKNALWFWVADERDVDRIIKAARGRLNIKRWGFGMNT